MSNSHSESRRSRRDAGTAGAVYGLGFVGAAVYYLQHAHGFWAGVLGVLKAIVWPAFVTHGLLRFLKL